MVRAHFALALSLMAALAAAQSPVPHASALPLTAAENRTARAFEAARRLGPGGLYAFLRPMPKGADLHMHLSGAVYAETFLAEAIQDSLCVDPMALKLTPHAVSPTKAAPCLAATDIPASSVLRSYEPVARGYTGQGLYDALIDSFSMRSFVPSPGVSGHDQFFATFERFGGLKDSIGEWLDEVATRAAAQNEQYLEIMHTPPFKHATTLGNALGWPAGAGSSISREQLAALRDQLLAAGIRDEVAEDARSIAEAETARRSTEHCATAASPACAVKIHFLFQVLRAFPPQQVFAQTLLGFEVASADPDFVGINFVQPEDDRIAMQDYHLQMQMLDYLHSVYPKVRISLHAGELAPGLVPPEGMRFHIREAIQLGHAERIGHGVDVLYEDDAPALLQEMAAKHVMVEINLTSNEGILGIKGPAHPLAAYRAAHVPVALSTDDEGVSRTNLTQEYVKGAEEQGLSYMDLKTMARTSLEHAFLAGQSLWMHADDFRLRAPACAQAITATSQPAPACAAFLSANERAAEQWEMEHRFAVFERNQ